MSITIKCVSFGKFAPFFAQDGNAYGIFCLLCCIKVNSMTTSSQLGSYPLGSTPAPGKTYVVFDVTVTNQNKDNLYLGNPLYFKLTTADGTVYQYSPASYWLNNHLTGVFNTKPGDKVTGQLAFEIPQSAKPTQLTYGDLINGVVTANL